MALKNRKKARNTLKRTSATEDSDSSGSTSTNLLVPKTLYAHNSEEEVVRRGYILLLICWLVFVGGVGGVLGIWDRVFGFEENKIVDLACYFSLIIVTGFTWTVLNWVGLKSFRMTSSKVQ